MLSPDDYPWANAGQWTHSPALDDPQEAPPQASYYEPRSTVTKQSSPPKRRVSKVQDQSYRYSKEVPPLVYEKYNYDSQTKQTGLPNRRESKPAPDEFRQYQEVPPTSNHDIYDALTKQSVPYKRKESLRNPTSKSNSWQSAPDGNWRYIGRSAEFDLEAQSRLPATPNQFSTHVPGHSTKADLPTQMEPLAPGTTPPPSPIQTFHILPSLNSHVDSINPSRQHYASTSYPFSPRIEYKFPHHVEIKQPRATRSINFDILAMHGEFEEPRVPNSDKVRNITVQYVGQAYKEFLRLTREVEKRFGGKREEHGNRPPVVLRKPEHHPNASGHRHVRTATPRPPEHLSDKQTGAFLSPSKTSPDTASDSDASYHDCLTESSVKPSPVPEKPRAISTNVATFDTTPARRTRSQQYASAYSRMERSFPPTSHAAVCGLYLVNDTLHRMDLLDVKFFDDVEDSLVVAQECLRRQRTLTKEQWDVRTDPWAIQYQERVEKMAIHVESISGWLERKSTRLYHIHLLGERVRDLANKLNASFDQLERQFLDKQCKIWEKASHNILTALHG